MAGKALMSAMSSSNMEAEKPGDGIRRFIKNEKFKTQMLKQGKGKYATPVRYAIRKGLGNIKDKVEDISKNVKEGFQRNQAEKDASGKRPGRNSSVGVCTAGGKCQQ